MPRPKAPKKKDDTWLFADKVYHGHVCLMTEDGVMITGSCRFTGKKNQKKGGDAIFEITLIKQL